MAAALNKLICLLLLTCISLQSFSQKQVFTGYCIQLNGDTLKGEFLNYKPFITSPSKVNFRPVNQTGSITITPANYTLFAVDGFDTYIAYNGNRITDPDNEKAAELQISASADKYTYAGASAFLRLIAATDNIKLYELQDRIRINFFYQLNNDALQELRYKVYVLDNSVHNALDYQRQLQTLLPDRDASALTYTEDDLAVFINGIVPKNANPDNSFNGFILSAGLSINFLSVPSHKIGNDSYNYNSSVSPLLKAGYILSLGNGSGKFFFNPNINFYNFKNTGDENNYLSSSHVEYTAGLVANFSLNFGINLLNKPAVKLFISAGAGPDVLINNRVIRTQDSVSIAKDEGFLIRENIQAGIISKHFIFSAGFILPTIITNQGYLNTQLGNVQITMGYKF